MCAVKEGAATGSAGWSLDQIFFLSIFHVYVGGLDFVLLLNIITANYPTQRYGAVLAATALLTRLL